MWKSPEGQSEIHEFFDAKTQTLTVKPAAKDGTVKITVTCGDGKDELEVKVKAAEKKPATVTSVTVSAKKSDDSALTSPATDVTAGSYTFTAKVEGTNDPAQTVTWKVAFKDTAEEATPNSSFGTGGTANVLTVEAGDTGKTLVITATSTADPTKTSDAFEITVK